MNKGQVTEPSGVSAGSEIIKAEPVHGAPGFVTIEQINAKNREAYRKMNEANRKSYAAEIAKLKADSLKLEAEITKQEALSLNEEEKQLVVDYKDQNKIPQHHALDYNSGKGIAPKATEP